MVFLCLFVCIFLKCCWPTCYCKQYPLSSDVSWPENNNISLEDIWFYQDGATFHFANEAITGGIIEW